MAKAKSATIASKKVGTSRVTRRGRTVAVGTAKHSYKTVAAAKTAYTRLRSAKAVTGFKAKYGKKSVRKAAPKRRRAVRKAAPKRRRVVRRKAVRKAAPKRRRAARKNPVRRAKRRTARRSTRRNAPMSRAEAGSVQSILRRHGYIR